MLSFWRGSYANCLKSIPNSLSRLLIYDNLIKSLQTSEESAYSAVNKSMNSVMAAFASSIAANIIGYPLERARVIMSLDMRSIDSFESKPGVIKTVMGQMRL